MFMRLLFLLVFVASTVFAQQIQCNNEYDPTKYKNHNRVPTDCKVEDLNCRESWKNGIDGGGDTDPPLVDHRFLNCHEGLTACGYVPIDPKDGKVLGTSGVTIGAGVDLGSKSRREFPGIEKALVDKIEPYFGLKKNKAACAILERSLQLTVDEAKNLTVVIKDAVVRSVSDRYDKDKLANAKSFASLPRGVRTAIASVWYQFGLPSAYPRFWGFVTKNDWEGAVKELRNFYTNPDELLGNLKRRNDEADIVEAALAKCNRSVDVVFLLDDSGSVSKSSFQESLDFLTKLVKAFPDDKLDGDDGTRFGLSTFSSSYSTQFYLSNYTNTSRYEEAISRVPYRGGGTNLGIALGEILDDQFTEEHGLRPEVDGLPRLLIVLTDGKASDEVATPAENVRKQSITIYAIGIGNYDISQLEEITTSEHIYLLTSFSELEKFIATITATTCYEPRPVTLEKKVKTKVLKDAYEFFSYKVKPSSNLMLNVVDLVGSTFVYASRTNPHPHKYGHDIAFDLSKQKNKVIIISGELKSTPKRSRRANGEELTQIYVSVTSDSDSAEFTIEGSECNPLNCTEGTNEIPPTTTRPTTTPLPATTQPPTTSFACFFTASKFIVVGVCILIILF